MSGLIVSVYLSINRCIHVLLQQFVSVSTCGYCYWVLALENQCNGCGSPVQGVVWGRKKVCGQWVAGVTAVSFLHCLLDDMKGVTTLSSLILIIGSVCLCHCLALSLPCCFLAPCDKRKHSANTDSAWRHPVWLLHSSLGFQRPVGRRSYRLTPQASAIVACHFQRSSAQSRVTSEKKFGWMKTEINYYQFPKTGTAWIQYSLAKLASHCHPGRHR